jgi:hypothetical protein
MLADGSAGAPGVYKAMVLTQDAGLGKRGGGGSSAALAGDEICTSFLFCAAFLHTPHI